MSSYNNEAVGKYYMPSKLEFTLSIQFRYIEFIMS